MSLLNDTLCHEILLKDLQDRPNETYVVSNLTYPLRPYYFKDLDYVDYIKIVAFIIIIVGGLLGNISVILTVALNRSMRTTINYYVANLAVADALICIFCMGPALLGTLTHPFFIQGAFMCKFNPFVQMTCLTSSVLTLSSISCDRFMAIMFPLHVRITKQRTSIVMQVVWFVSILVAIPFLLVKKHSYFRWLNFVEPSCSERWPLVGYYDEEIGECKEYEPYRRIYYMVVSVTLYFLPVLVMITAYSLILWKLWISEVPGERSAANMNVQYRARKKVIKMVMVVLVAFVICWTPLQSVIFYGAFGRGESPIWFDNFKWFCYYIAYANSFMNPIIYGGFNKAFRDGFCLVLKCGYQSDRYSRGRIHNTSGPSPSTQKTSVILKSLRIMYSSMTSLRRHTSRILFKPKVKVPMYRAELVKATAV